MLLSSNCSQNKAPAHCRHTIAARLQRSLCFVLVATGLLRTSQAQDPISPIVHMAEAQLEDGRANLDAGTLMTALRVFEDCARKDAANARCYFDMGRTDSYLADIRERQMDKRAAQQTIDSAIDNIQRSIDLNAGFADAHALLAELYGRKIGYGGVFTAIRMGPKAQAETERAMELDPKDPRIYIVIGRRQLYSPRMFGGDVEKAIESFRKATTVDPHCDEGFVWLAIANTKKGDSRAARAAVEEALRLNGRNVIALEIRSAMR